MFRPDLYRAVADDYDRFRLPYPPALTDSLLTRTRPSGTGHLLDLACGTGQPAFALCSAFAVTWAVDQEADMIRVVTARGGVHAVMAAAENLDAPAGRFDLAVIGNAFHRLPRALVAARLHTWLRPGGSVALCWSDAPWDGDEAWQPAFREVLARWRSRLGVEDRLPAGWADDRAAHPDTEVLAAAGLRAAGDFSITITHRWTPASLAGFTYATSFLPRPVFGSRSAAFEAELADALAGHQLDQSIGYSYQLASKP